MVIFRELHIPTSYTLEATFYGCDTFKDQVCFSRPSISSSQKAVDSLKRANPVKRFLTANITAALERDGIHISDTDLVNIGEAFCETIYSILQSKVLKKKFMGEENKELIKAM